MTFRELVLRRHFPIRLRRWRFERWPFVVTFRLNYEDDVWSVRRTPWEPNNRVTHLNSQHNQFHTRFSDRPFQLALKTSENESGNTLRYSQLLTENGDWTISNLRIQENESILPLFCQLKALCKYRDSESNIKNIKLKITIYLRPPNVEIWHYLKSLKRQPNLAKHEN